MSDEFLNFYYTIHANMYQKQSRDLQAREELRYLIHVALVLVALTQKLIFRILVNSRGCCYEP